ncbi:MAG: hypothetical protein PSN37_04730 [Alphaproteobacteria bacterium]|nr:hypothetical protein [Alphaproteobacteria bacterium]
MSVHLIVDLPFVSLGPQLGPHDIRFESLRGCRYLRRIEALCGQARRMVGGELQHVTTRDACGDLWEVPEFDANRLTAHFALIVKCLRRFAREQAEALNLGVPRLAVGWCLFARCLRYLQSLSNHFHCPFCTGIARSCLQSTAIHEYRTNAINTVLCNEIRCFGTRCNWLFLNPPSGRNRTLTQEKRVH